jgi:hypothetical protein
MKRIVWLFIDKKTHLLVVMTFEVKKYGLIVWLEHHKMENFILIHIPNLLLGFNIWYNIRL